MTTHHRLGSARMPKSNIHGTNGCSVPLPSSGAGVNCCGYCSLSPAGTSQRIQYPIILFTVTIILMPSVPSRDSSSNRIVAMVLARIHSYWNASRMNFYSELYLCQLERRTHQHQTTEILFNLRQVSMYMGVILMGSWFYRWYKWLWRCSDDNIDGKATENAGRSRKSQDKRWLIWWERLSQRSDE